MATTRWVVPCNFISDTHTTNPIIFDLTSHLKTILTNNVWNRKFRYGFSEGLKNTNLDDINSATVKVFPIFVSGQVNQSRIPELIHAHYKKLPAYLKINSYKRWPYNIGFAVIEISYFSFITNIPSRKDLTEEFIPNVEMEFIEKHDHYLAVVKELSAFFLAALHLTFPTEFVMMRSNNPLNDGYFQILSGRRTYASQVSTGAYMHRILIETNKSSNLLTNLKGLSEVWHLDLWSLHRYLKAVESDDISIDNLLDLIYSLEGMFESNTSAEFVKIMCMINLCKSKNEAKRMRSLLDLAYNIRNKIVHGGVSYDIFEQVKLEGRNIPAQKVYWKIKGIVASMLIRAISKLLSNRGMRNLRFNTDDFIDIAFSI